MHSVELMMVLPLVLLVLLGTIEFACLLMAQQSLAHATYLGARRASVCEASSEDIERTVRGALGPSMGRKVRVSARVGQDVGEAVVVHARVPMQSAAPDFLGWIGVSLQGRELQAAAVLRKE
jgi:Flp pilus assembly protein TadG